MHKKVTQEDLNGGLREQRILLALYSQSHTLPFAPILNRYLNLMIDFLRNGDY